MSMFVKASKKKAKLRMSLEGPSGSGKTYSALSIGTNLGEKVVVIDTERGSADKYSDVFTFDTFHMDVFTPDRFMQVIQAAEKEGYDVLIIDSLSHAWQGTKDEVTKVQSASRSGNGFEAWGKVTPKYKALVDTILRCKMHVIVTMRVKTEWVIEDNDKGKKAPRKVGLKADQKDDFDYEMDVAGVLSKGNVMSIEKTRYSAINDMVFEKPGKEFAQTILDWLSDGVAVTELVPPPPPSSTDVAEKIKGLAKAAVDMNAFKEAASLFVAKRETLSQEDQVAVRAVLTAEQTRLKGQAA